MLLCPYFFQHTKKISISTPVLLVILKGELTAGESGSLNE
jgi:hypothetical protein